MLLCQTELLPRACVAVFISAATASARGETPVMSLRQWRQCMEAAAAVGRPLERSWQGNRKVFSLSLFSFTKWRAAGFTQPWFQDGKVLGQISGFFFVFVFILFFFFDHAHMQRHSSTHTHTRIVRRSHMDINTYRAHYRFCEPTAECKPALRLLISTHELRGCHPPTDPRHFSRSRRARCFPLGHKNA